MQAETLDQQLSQLDLPTLEQLKLYAQLSKMIENAPNRQDLEKTLMGITEEKKLTTQQESAITDKVTKAFSVVEKFNIQRKLEKEEADSSRLNSSRDSHERQQRGYVDGCFDLMHAGHFNAIRQASYLTPWLVVGPNSDEEILMHKGPTVLSSEERAFICRSLKWTDEVYQDAPYVVSEDVLDGLNCQFYVHGDDPVYDLEGNDMCAMLTAKNRYKMIKRTTGISTTDLTGRLLELLEHDDEENEEEVKIQMTKKEPPKQQFLQTSTRIALFSNRREPVPGETIVYFSASCDLMHPGVIERMKVAKQQGDFLYVGVWDDETIKYYKGSKYPLQGL